MVRCDPQGMTFRRGEGERQFWASYSLRAAAKASNRKWTDKVPLEQLLVGYYRRQQPEQRVERELQQRQR